MFSSIKKYFKTKLFNILLSENDGFKLKFFQLAQNEFKKKSLDEYRHKYKIDKSFRFNGDMILFYGEGEIICRENSYISDYSMLQSFTGCKIEIGKGCSLSSNVRIFTQTNIADQDFDKTEIEIKTGNVIIGDHVWIGSNVVINPGIKIGANSIIGANSVVSKDIPEFAIYGGVPARLIRQKKYNQLIYKLITNEIKKNFSNGRRWIYW